MKNQNRGNAGKGRPKGAKNKSSMAVRQKMEELGCDPIEGIIECLVPFKALMNEALENDDAETATKAAERCLPF